MGIKVHHAIALWIADRVGKDHASLRMRTLLKQMRHLGAIENVVAQHQGHRVGANEVLSQHKGLGQAVGLGLNGVVERSAAQLAAVAQQILEEGRVVGRGNDEDFAEYPPASMCSTDSKSWACRRRASTACSPNG